MRLLDARRKVSLVTAGKSLPAKDVEPRQDQLLANHAIPCLTWIKDTHSQSHEPSVCKGLNSLPRCVIPWWEQMQHIWYVTFQVPRRGILPRKRNPRETRTFATETEAKNFARTKLDEGLMVHAGTINPHSPKAIIPPGGILRWLEGAQEENADPAGAKSE
jgi:hypothetical protein